MPEEASEIVERFSVFEDFLWLGDISNAFETITKLADNPVVLRYKEISDAAASALKETRAMARKDKRGRSWVAQEFVESITKRNVKPSDLALASLASRIGYFASNFPSLVGRMKKEFAPEVRATNDYDYVISPERDMFEVRILLNKVPVQPLEFTLPIALKNEGFSPGEPQKGGRSILYRIFSPKSFIEILVQSRKIRITITSSKKMEDDDVDKLVKTLMQGLGFMTNSDDESRLA